MKRLIIPLLSLIALPSAIQANIDPKVAEICMKASDFQGCIQSMSVIKKEKSPKKEEDKKDIDTFVPHGDSSSSSGDSKFKIVEEVSYPSLDEALELKFDLNNSTNIH